MGKIGGDWKVEGLIILLVILVMLGCHDIFLSKKPSRIVCPFLLGFSGRLFCLMSHLYFWDSKWNGAGLFIIVTIYLYIAQLNRKRLLYFLLSAFILMLLTVCFLFFELFDPVWILIDREWLLAIFVIYGALLLHSDKNARCYRVARHGSWRNILCLYFNEISPLHIPFQSSLY